MSKILFSGWWNVAHVLIAGGLGYLSLLVIVRLSGKRSLSTMNAFDMMVTVSIGSTLANVLLNNDVSLVEGIAAFAVLIGLSFLISFFSVRSERFRSLALSNPRLLYYKGKFLDDALRSERINKEEIYAVMRNQGIASLEAVEAVVLETQGVLSVVRTSEARNRESFEDMREQVDEAESVRGSGEKAA